MRMSVFVGISLDGFITRQDGSYGFLPPDGGEASRCLVSEHRGSISRLPVTP